MDTALDYPGWLRATHFLNFLFLTLLVRSGLQILSASPRLYLNDHCRPGSEVLKFSRREVPKDKLWTASDLEETWSPVIALPGRPHGLGLGRHWHFVAVVGWILTGAVYLVLLFAADEWRRLVPTSWGIVPDALRALEGYLTFDPPAEGGAYNALQQLSYFIVVFMVAPLQIATGAAMSPAIDARYPRYVRLFGGRQRARFLHFLLTALFCLFLVVHVAVVAAHGLGRELAKIVLGSVTADHTLALTLAGVGVLGVIVLNVLATLVSVRHPKTTRRALGTLIAPLELGLTRTLRPSLRKRTIPVSEYHWVNGRPPADDSYLRSAANGFADWRLSVEGLVARPCSFGLDELRAMPAVQRRSLHHCIQGWSSIADWRGVPVQEVLERCELLPDARFAVFWGMDDKSRTDTFGHGLFYEAVRLDILRDGGAFLAYEMNGEPLPAEYGAPLRLRLDNQLGFKMVKWLARIEIVTDIRDIGEGHGGWREDQQEFENVVAI
ncbi:molybdopterin-dependent oxidoreductase [Streptomyces sp. NPDC052693]|uniref:molybdopterin-dependent oxidoreductase n=1 Tax=Streptomyces sp. NPDC052693 TaxID=3155814 RepID=UPI0034166C0E